MLNGAYVNLRKFASMGTECWDRSSVISTLINVWCGLKFIMVRRDSIPVIDDRLNANRYNWISKYNNTDMSFEKLFSHFKFVFYFLQVNHVIISNPKCPTMG